MATINKMILQEVIDQLMNKSENDWSKIDTGIAYDQTSKRIVLPGDPEKMPVQEAISALKRVERDLEQTIRVKEIFDYHPLEAAVAFYEAMRQTYGIVSSKPMETIWGENPPELFTIQTGLDSEVQVPLGNFELPNIPGDLHAGFGKNRGVPAFFVHAEIKKVAQPFLLELARITREILKQRSIYKNKAIYLTTDAEGDLMVNLPPKFIDLSKVQPESLILNTDVQYNVDVNIFAPLTRTHEIRRRGQSLKRGILLSGHWGTGKTLLSQIVAKIAVDNDWTFIGLDKPQSLKEGLMFAQRYQPAVVFCEDIDRAAQERGEDENDLLNIMDGILTKNTEIMVVVTTNHLGKIIQPMLRPGRFDSIIRMNAPNADSVKRLIYYYGGDRIDPKASLDEVANLMKGQVASAVAEVVKRAEYACIMRNQKLITDFDLEMAATSLKDHLNLLNPQEEKAKSELELSLRNIVREEALAAKNGYTD